MSAARHYTGSTKTRNSETYGYHSGRRRRSQLSDGHGGPAGRGGLRGAHRPRGQEGLKIAGSADVDLVLTDMKMPKMSGIELLGELQRLYPDLPVIIMTAYGTVEKAVRP